MVNSIRVGAWSRCATTVSNTGKISWAVNARRGRGREKGNAANVDTDCTLRPPAELRKLAYN